MAETVNRKLFAHSVKQPDRQPVQLVADFTPQPSSPARRVRRSIPSSPRIAIMMLHSYRSRSCQLSLRCYGILAATLLLTICLAAAPISAADSQSTLEATAAPVTTSTETPPPGFKPIFDGETLDGWHARPHYDPRKLAAMDESERTTLMAEWKDQAMQHWTVQNGELINDGKGPYLVTNDDFTDYELVVDYKTVPLADSGIYLKANPQVQIWDHTNERAINLGADKGSGGLWNNSKGAPGKDPIALADKPFGEWNRFFIRQIGARTTVYLNDVLIVDNAIMENYWDRESPLFTNGPIELQTHGGEIRWKNIWVNELSAAESNAILQAHQANEFTTLFNGSDLTGWQGSVDSYEVVEGAIQCKSGAGGNLLAEKEYANFVARLEFKLPPGGNNGLAIRAPLDGDTAYKGMCELQVLDTEHPKYANLDPRQAHGSAYGMVAAKRGYVREAGLWNFQEVTVDGSMIKVEVNGNVILDADLASVTEYLADRPHPGKERTSGFFGFAGHNDPVAFRNISIKELP